MKVKKKWKKYVHQIALACLLICCVVQWMPESAYADDSLKLPSYDFKIIDNNDTNNFDLYKFKDSGRCVSFYYNNTTDAKSCFTTAVISTSPISDSATHYIYQAKYGGGSLLYKESDDRVHSFTFLYNSIKYYISYYSMTVYYGSRRGNTYSGRLGAFYLSSQPFNSESESEALISDYIAGHVPYTCTLVCDGGEDGEVSTDVGSVNNPIEDSEIGTIEISGKAYAQDTTANSDNIDEQFYTMWNWKNKTSTGFSLTKNKYHMTRIQVMVESRCLVYSDLKHKTVKEKFENYGERNKLKNGILPTDKPYTIYLKDVMSALPKTKGEFHNVLFCGYNFKYYWRVMCNDSPTGTGKWYCGGWRAVDLNQDSNKSKDINDTNNGHFDDDENWVNDEDDGHNNTTDYSDDVSGQNPDDAKDTITNPKKDKDDKFGWDDFKSLINECKQVPGLIKSVFSFLPDWVLAFVAIGFGIWIFVLIKRAIV